jgi:hypothetical protein
MSFSHQLFSNSTAAQYRKYFKLYHATGSFILDIKTSDFFRYDMNTHKWLLNDEVAAVFSFLRPCSETANFAMFRMYFWSPDGQRFHMMQQASGGSSGPAGKIVYFETTDLPSDKKCMMKFTPENASLLESLPPLTDEDNLSEDDLTELHLEDSDDEASLPPSRSLITFECCPRKQLELLLEDIKNEKINLIPCAEELKPVHLLKLEDKDVFLSIGTLGSNTKIKMGDGNIFNDLNVKLIVIMSDGSGTMRASFEEDAPFSTLEINNPYLDSYQAHVILADGTRVNLIKCEIELIQNAGKHRLTPLDIASVAGSTSARKNQ